MRVEPPLPVRLRAGAALGEGWQRAASGVLGEFQTRELLARAGGGGSARAAEGWGGDRYELWRRGSECAAPCRRDAALVARWRWDTVADQREFATKLRQWVRDGLGPVEGGSVAVAVRGGAVTLAMAPGLALARRLARSGTAAG